MAVILIVAAGGLFLVGCCECNREEFTSFCDNLSGSPWRQAMDDCKRDMDNDFRSGPRRIAKDLSGLDRNTSGTAWREDIIGKGNCPAGGNPAGPGRQQ